MSKTEDSHVDILNLRPYEYAHVMETNNNITSIVVGPTQVALTQNMQLVEGPCPMVKIPTNHHVVIRSPVIRDENRNIVLEDFGQVKLRLYNREVRHNKQYPEPFPLYPGEEMIGDVQSDYVIKDNETILLNVLEDYEENKKRYILGDEIILKGPLTFVPRKEQEVVEIRSGWLITRNKSLLLSTTKDTLDDDGVKRKAGDSWLYKKLGNYLKLNPDISCERFIEAIILDSNTAIELSAKTHFVDVYGNERKAGEKWLVTQEMTSTHFVDVHEELIQKKKRVVVREREYCVILNPMVTLEDGSKIQRYGGKKLVRGPSNFFLLPDEEIEGGKPVRVHVLTEEEGLLLYAVNEFEDETGIIRRPGEKWLVTGPGDYIPPTDVKVAQKRSSIPLSENEGIYIKNLDTGEVRSHIGSTYMLKASEALFEKELDVASEEQFAIETMGIPYIPPKMVNGKLVYEKPDISEYVRDQTKVICYKISSNKVVQLFNFKTKETKIIFGPALAMLEPDEVLTLLSLSGLNPKVENSLQTLSLLLGPSTMSDTVIVETADHAKLAIQLSYDWHFKYDKENPNSKQNKKIFSTRDFIGDICKTISSRIRGSVSAISYNDFHHNSAEILCSAVFGRTKEGKLKERLLFQSNNCVVTSCDIKSQRPVEKDIEEKLKKNTFLGIAIKTNATKMEFLHKTSLLEQESQGELELKKLEDDKLAEKEKINLYKTIAEKESIVLVSKATSEARAVTETKAITAKNNLDLVGCRCEEKEIRISTANSIKVKENEIIIEHERKMGLLQIEEKKALTEIEVSKLQGMISALGADTLTAMINAGPEMKVEMLKALGLQGYLMTDGKNPINLFDTADGLVQPQGGI